MADAVGRVTLQDDGGGGGGGGARYPDGSVVEEDGDEGE